MKHTLSIQGMQERCSSAYGQSHGPNLLAMPWPIQEFQCCSSAVYCCSRFLIETGFDQLAEAMYKAPFVCLAHNIFEEGVEDPLFTYANKAALELFEADWDTLIGLPSRNSAEPESQQV